METGYQRGKIQEESLLLRASRSTTASYPIVGVNTFRNPHGDPVPQKLELARSTDDEKQSQLKRLRDFHARHAAEAPAMLARLQQAVIDNGNVFEVLMDAVRVCSLGPDHATRCSRSAASTGAACSRHVTVVPRCRCTWPVVPLHLACGATAPGLSGRCTRRARPVHPARLAAASSRRP